jgi:hypothetical protein
MCKVFYGIIYVHRRQLPGYKNVGVLAFFMDVVEESR